MWPGCDDLLTKPFPLAPGARTVGSVTPKLAKLTPKVFDHTVGNHVVQSVSEKSRRSRDCGCISQLSVYVNGYFLLLISTRDFTVICCSDARAVLCSSSYVSNQLAPAEA